MTSVLPCCEEFQAKNDEKHPKILKVQNQTSIKTTNDIQKQLI
jgi:hypothetical protein